MKVPRGARLGAQAPAIVEARLRATTGAASDADYRLAMAKIVSTGTVPAGWELESVRWGHFTVRGEETDSFRFKRWQAGQAVDLASFPVGLFTGAVVGIERVEGRRARVVERQAWATVARRVATGRARSTRTGRWVRAAYAKRYPHLVEREYVVQRVRRRVVRKERVPVEEAVIRFTYAAGFSVFEMPKLGQ